MREIAALKLDAFRCPLSLDLAVASPGNRVQNRNVSAGPGRRSVGRRRHYPVRRTFASTVQALLDSLSRRRIPVLSRPSEVSDTE